MSIHTNVAATVPQLNRGRVWCLTCGRTERVDAVYCLHQGWPKCCGQTMTIDSPEERAAFDASRHEEPGA